MTLYVKPISAILTHDTDTFSNMDPYVIIEIGGSKQKTKVHKEGGKKPHWDQIFTFNPKGNKMVVTVMDKDTITSDDKVGSGAVDLHKYMQDPIEHKQYISLTHGSKNAGKIYISIRYVPNGNQQPNSNWAGNQQPQNWQQGQQGQNWSQGQKGQNWSQGQPGQQQNSWGNQPNQPSQWGQQQNQLINPGQSNNQQWGQQGQQGQSSWGNPNQPQGGGGFNNNGNSSWGQNNNQQSQQIPLDLAGQFVGKFTPSQQNNNSNWGGQGIQGGQQPQNQLGPNQQPQSQWGTNNNGWGNPAQNQSSWGNQQQNNSKGW